MITALLANVAARRALLVLSVVGASAAPLWPTPSATVPSADATEVVPEPTTTEVAPELLASLGPADLPVGCDAPNRHLSLYAVELERVEVDGVAEIRLGYGVTPETASIPGPTIEMIEGECLAITVTNLVSQETLGELRDHPRLGMIDPDPADPLPLGVSLHVHGVKYTQSSDGTMHTGSWIPPGQARTYVWYAEPRTVAPDGRVLSHGTAGYWWFHDHVAGTDHGTGGIGSGLFGALVVRRAGDPLPDRTFALAMGNDASINLRTYPDTDTCDPSDPVPSDTCLLAYAGETVEFVVFGIGDDFHTFHLHGHTWVDNRNGVLVPTDEHAQLVDVISLGPSASFGFQVVAGASVGDGDWMIHCHVQRHSDLGMFTFLHVVEPGSMVLGDAGSIDSFESSGPEEGLPDNGARHRGASEVPIVEVGLEDDGTVAVPKSSSSQPDLGYWCSLPLSAWAAERSR